MKEQKNDFIIPKVDYKQATRAWKKFLRRHGYRYDDNAMLIKPVKKGGEL